MFDAASVSGAGATAGETSGEGAGRRTRVGIAGNSRTWSGLGEGMGDSAEAAG